jgi:uridine kinase
VKTRTAETGVALAAAAARLTRERCLELARARPALAVRLLAGIVEALEAEGDASTEGAPSRRADLALPPPAQVRVRIGEREERAPVGTPLREVLADAPCEGRVVAALLDGKAVSLETPVVSDAVVAPLGEECLEGRRVLRTTIGLLLLEAAARAAPGTRLRLGATVEGGQLVTVEGAGAEPPASLAARLTEAMRALSAENPPVRLETWAVDEAREALKARGETEAAALLRTSREGTARLVTAGRVYALAAGPLLPRLGGLESAALLPSDGGYLLAFGDEAPPEAALAAAHRMPKDAREMARAHEAWLGSLGVDGVGAFNERCISGQVAELIRVSEGFQEKRIGAIADRIAARGGAVRVVCVAGPSSAGKTTFLKRLTVQLRVNGVNPIGLSLDDYYRDRDATPRDERGELDFEALEALDVPRLDEDLARVLAGESVRTPRFDFVRGRCVPDGGPEVRLGPSEVLLLEGIHGLNPRLLGGAVGGEQVFRVFLDPTTTLRFDALSRMSAADLRLLRRIVRDRFRRGASAADNIARWASVRAGERRHIFPFAAEADAAFDSALVYEPSVLKVYAERYLLEVPRAHPSFATAHRLRHLIDRFITIYPDHVPSTSILREFIGGSGFEY